MINFEKKTVIKFVENIFISVCYCLEQENDIKLINENEIIQSICTEPKKYTIRKREILENPNLLLSRDKIVKDREDFKIHIEECAPKIFKYLRNLDGQDINKLIRSFLPSLNKTGIGESEGRSGNFFISTYDKQYLLKTINFNEANLLTSKLLFEMSKHLSSNSNSLISRLYGLYKIKMKTSFLSEEEIYIILMKNVFGTFDEENIIVKFDLKGSALNRRVSTIKDQIMQPNVLKDINFTETEKVLEVSEKNSKLLKNIINSDTKFLCKQGIMDYSLLVIKICVTDLENKIIFGENVVDFHKRLYERLKKKIRKEYYNTKENNIESDKKELIDKIVEKLNDDNLSNRSSNSYSENIEVNDETKKNKLDYMKNDITFEPKYLPSIKKYCWPSFKPDFFYVIAIIDFFQLYDLNKKLETGFKGMRNKKEDISSMEPVGYEKRFIEAMTKITDYKNILEKIVEEEFSELEKKA
jgi:hypothetical protein